RGMVLAGGSVLVCTVLLAVWSLWPGSALQAKPPEGEEWALYQRLTSLNKAAPAKLMGSIVPLIFVFFLIPGLVHGFVSGTFRTHRDAVKGMSKAMESMSYYLVLVFFAALFIASFTESGFGALLAVKGAAKLKAMNASPGVTIAGVILLSTTVNLLIGSASAKWAMLSPIFVPMLMLLGISPELTQAAYRVGDSCTNIITPMMPYFPLVVVFCQKYVKSTGLGTVTSLMLPYSMTFLVLWTVFLFVYWQLGMPLGIQGGYEYMATVAPAAG
ncbi:MAG: AbgT family transporter, partial [Planctomyces sp.]